jgi:L-ascorbate metabolism protein UlaG (beta-lactamase superfamily)
MRRQVFLGLSLLLLVFLTACTAQKVTKEEKLRPKKEVKRMEQVKTGGINITWYGHAMFLIDAGEGKKIITDPFDERVGYPLPAVSADIVTVSHDHFDHNNTTAIGGNPQVVRILGSQTINGVKITGIGSFHDETGGSQRGENTIYVFEIGELKIVHLGDLGHILTGEQVGELANVDILLIPVGGNYTIGAEAAAKVVEQIKPKVVIPMHYKTADCTIDIASVDDFTAKYGSVEHKPSTVSISKTSLPASTQVWVMDYVR